MLPKFLHGTYKRYKEDTGIFTQWLVEAARNCGYEPALKEASRNGPKKSKESSKARKITVKELVALAEVVASSRAVRVPKMIIATARKAIALRKRSAEWFALDTSKSSAAGNLTHTYFITALERICDILEKTWSNNALILSPSRDKPGSDVHQTASDPAKDASNLFSALSLQDADDLEDIEIPAKVLARIEIEVDEAEEGDEESQHAALLFGIFCLFADLNSLREFAASSAKEYLNDDIDLTNFSVVTDTVVRLAQELIDDFSDTWPDFPVDEQSQMLLFNTGCICRGALTTPSGGLPYNHEMSDLADWCFIGAQILLNSFARVLQPGQAPVYKPGYYGTYNSKARREIMSVAEKFNEDKVILLELLPEFAFMASMTIILPTDDEITRGLIRYVKDKKVGLWLSFAMQILLDVHHALRYTPDKAFNDLRLFAMRTKKTIDEYWKLSSTFSGENGFWALQGDHFIKDVQKDVEDLVLDDAIYKLKQAAFSDTKAASNISPRHFLLKSHATLGGLIMFNFALRMQQVGMALINQWYDVGQLAYLYILVQQTGVKGLQWPDMDLFIDINGEEKIFIGGQPKTASETLKKLSLATGISKASDFARDSRGWRRPGLSGGTNRARLIEPSSAVVNIFHDRYIEHGRSKISVENVNNLMNELFPTNSKRGDKDAKSLAIQPMRDRWASAKRVGALQLLTILKQGLYAEEPRVQFNYFAMHQRSIEVLRRIQTKEHHKFVQYFTPLYMDNDTLISNLVLLILTVADGSGRSAPQLGLGQGRGESVVSRMVLSCEEVMHEYLRVNGDKNCKELKTFCKNKTVGSTRATNVKPSDYGFLTFVGEQITPATRAALETGIRLS